MSYNKHERHTECFTNNDIDFYIDEIPGEFFGLHLALENNNYITNLFDNSTTNIESLAATSGGAIFYGHNYSEKKFNVKCFYYIDDVKEGFLNDVYNFYNSGNKRKLYFSEFPWIEYEVVISKITNQVISSVAGTITLEIICPKGYGIFRNPNVSSGDIYNRFINNTGYIKDVPINKYGETTKTITSQTEFYLYSPSNRKTRTVIEITGSAADGLNIYNENTGDMLRLRAFDTSTFTSPYTKLIVDSENGKTYLIDNTGTATTNGFKYHKAGLLSLAPSNKIDIGDITSVVKNGSYYNITVNKKAPGVIGKYFCFYISNAIKFMKIKSAVVADNSTTFTCESISGTFTPTTLEDTKVVDVNKLIITPVSTANCTVKISFIPEF